MSGVLTTRNGLLALGTPFVILMLLALSQEVIVEVGHLHGLLALLAESYHRAGGVEMLVPEVVVLEALVEGFAVVAVVLRILGLFFQGRRFLYGCALGLCHSVHRKTC